ncbi:uncharacterized protein A1O9_07955 [Exophiala aquamarina CBS 119918]|uniref:4-coumarate-CoA ligase n=1 Tax=Exophiala aquamarina CBS 119918 TaxID=1182545 RepID=A0A072P8F8_9EURO|nr:uncharacterized protein A1O9_07955 [Exophiala aquamarina CBS 119918]KEF56374.1 hypothetical protein A1O9_07955 [Exophiala aquamarina CBS 119918]
MPCKSRWPLTTPNMSIPTFMFGPPESNINNTEKVIIDAKRPGSHFLTLHSYRQWSRRFAAGLVAAGLKKGDRVMLFSGNGIFNPVVVMGALMAGGIYNSANPAYTPRELRHQLKDAEPSFVLAADNCIEKAFEAADDLGFDRKKIFLFTELPTVQHDATFNQGDTQHWSSLVSDARAGRQFMWEEFNSMAAADRTAILIYSSGTTGLPKGVELSHRSIISNMLQLEKIQLADKSIRKRLCLCVVPMYHALGLVYYIFFAPKWGLETYLMERYNLPDMLDHIQRFKITELVLVPPILVAMAKHPSVRDGTCDISSVRKVVAGAAPIGMEVTKQFEELWNGKVLVRQAWGMSEAPAITFCWDERMRTGASSVSIGELVPGAEAKLMKEDGTEETGIGKRGELWIRTPNGMTRYWGNRKATEDTMTSDGWLQTGDVAFCDEQDRWYMVDRIKELIKVRGAQVAPAELEALLLEHPQIVDAAVIGVKTPTDDENPRAYVVPAPLKPGMTSLREDDVVEFVNTRVSKVKHLTGGCVFTDAIPKNPSGKILRRQLRDQAAKEGESTAKL